MACSRCDYNCKRSLEYRVNTTGFELLYTLVHHNSRRRLLPTPCISGVQITEVALYAAVPRIRLSLLVQACLVPAVPATVDLHSVLNFELHSFSSYALHSHLP